ncbi:MAG: hypothetical protein ACI9LO_003062 [Planctomycetota bacterium]|jgi:hypothetical protein
MQSTHPFKLTSSGATSNYWNAKNRTFLIMVVLLTTFVLQSCAQIRKVTYPPDFVYLEHKKVTSQMALLGLYTRRLDEIIKPNVYVTQEQHQKVLEILSQINQVTDVLGAGSPNTNHLVIDDHIDQFKDGVTTAIIMAEAEPPNYFAAGQLSGSCVACHKFR